MDELKAEQEGAAAARAAAAPRAPAPAPAPVAAAQPPPAQQHLNWQQQAQQQQYAQRRPAQPQQADGWEGLSPAMAARLGQPSGSQQVRLPPPLLLSFPGARQHVRPGLQACHGSLCLCNPPPPLPCLALCCNLS